MPGSCEREEGNYARFLRTEQTGRRSLVGDGAVNQADDSRGDSLHLGSVVSDP
jgi:hypothetical protein